MEKELDEHTRKMKELFPDFPCARCNIKITNPCTHVSTCESWKKWFGDVWKKERERLKKYGTEN